MIRQAASDTATGSGIDGVLLDLSGVVYQGARPIAGALAAIGRLRAAGVSLRYLTNTTRSPCAAIRARLEAIGVPADSGELYTAPLAARDWVEQHELHPLLLVHPELRADFPGERYRRSAPDAVLVGDAGPGFSYATLNRAFRILEAGAPLLAMGMNRYFREDAELSLDAGPFVRALEYAADCKAVVLGKPAAGFFLQSCAAMGCAPERTVMVGDDVEADVLGAAAAGLHGILVRTGKYRMGDEQRLPETGRTAVCADLAEAVEDLLA